MFPVHYPHMYLALESLLNKVVIVFNRKSKILLLFCPVNYRSECLLNKSECLNIVVPGLL